MKHILLATFLCFAVSIGLRAQSLEWAVQYETDNESQGYGIAVDNAGNVYTVGALDGTTDMDPGPSVLEFVAAGNRDIYATKMTANGNLIWAYQLGGSTDDMEWGRAIAVDDDGNVYLTGGFTGSCDFDPGPGVVSLYGSGDGDGFVVKLDANGALVWAKRYGGSGTARGQSLTLDAAGNVVYTGFFSGTGSFYFGAEVVELTASGTTAFVCKVDPTGTTGWVRQFTGSTNCSGLEVITDQLGNIYTIGNFFTSIDLDPGAGVVTATAQGNSDVFVNKLDGDGNYLWGKALGGTMEDWGLGITVDDVGNVYGTGHFGATVDFDPGPGVLELTATGIRDSYLFKLNSAGDLEWAHGYGSSGGETGYAVECDAAGYVYASGYFTNTVDFDTGAGVYELTAAGTRDAYLLKLDPNGDLLWAHQFGGTSSCAIRAFVVDGPGAFIHATGYFGGTTDFAPGAETVELTADGSDSGFVVKLGPDVPEGIRKDPQAIGVLVAPNPSNGSVTISLDRNYRSVQVIFRDQLGKVVWQHNYASAQRISLGLDLATGVYMAEVRAEGLRSGVFKLVKE